MGAGRDARPSLVPALPPQRRVVVLSRALLPQRGVVVFALLALAVGACGRSDYLGAAVTGGLGIAGAGVHRATTKGCWGQCLNGLVCDQASGMCVEHARCGGKCGRNETCEEGTIARCVPIGERLATSAIEEDSDGGITQQTQGTADGGAIGPPAEK